MLLPSQAQGNCEPLTIPLCQGLQLYNDTIFPNMLNHTSQQEAALELNQFTPLVNVGCSRDLAHFLCSVYAPYCLVSKNLATPVPPCRSLCTSVKQGCIELMKRFGFQWPESLRCDRFPKLGEEICVDGNGIIRRQRFSHQQEVRPSLNLYVDLGCGGTKKVNWVYFSETWSKGMLLKRGMGNGKLKMGN